MLAPDHVESRADTPGEQPTLAAEPLAIERSAWRQPEPLFFAALACAISLGYTLYTKHVWEDWFITFRHSQNLVEGKGLVYNPGERVHGFTSPLGTLLPALCYLLTGQSSWLPALWLFRIFSMLALAGGAVLLLSAVPRPRHGIPWARVLLGTLYGLEFKAVAFSQNGMETGFMMLFLSWGIYLFQQNQARHWIAGGVCWAGLMWTRPDGFAYIAALALANLLFGEPDEAAATRVFGPRKKMFGALLASGAVCTVLYLPWFLWAWSYYGSRVPHTIIAKTSLGRSPVLDILSETPAPGTSWAAHALHVVQALGNLPGERAVVLFQPIYTDEVWHWQMPLFLALMAIFAVLYWLFPVKDRLGRMASFCFALLSGYLSFFRFAYPWYIPAVTLFALVALSQGIAALAGGAARTEIVTGPAPPLLLRTLGCALAVLLALVICAERAYLFGLTLVQMKIQQHEVESGERMRIGLWLKEHMREGDSVFLEPVGYIGYFSGAYVYVYDWPGLVSPEVVRLHKEQGVDWFHIPQELKPDWIVWRPDEAAEMSALPFAKEYELAASFDIHDRLASYAYIPGKDYLLFDSAFVVYKRKATAAPGPAHERQ